MAKLRGWLVLAAGILLAGRAGQAEAKLSDAVVARLPDYLKPDVGTRFNLRAQRGFRGAIAVSRDGAALTSSQPVAPGPATGAVPVAVDDGTEYIVVDQSPERVRAVFANPSFRLALWMARSALATVTMPEARLVAEVPPPEPFMTPGWAAPAPATGVFFAAGTRITTSPGGKKASEGWLAASYKDPAKRFKLAPGFMAAADLGTVYPDRALPPASDSAEVRGDARILDAPGGKELLRLSSGSKQWTPAARGEQRWQGFYFVTIDLHPVQVRGWVAARSVRELPGGGSMDGGFGIGGGFGGSSAQVRLPEGTILRAEGQTFGVLLRTGYYAVVKRRGRGVEPIIRIGTPFGAIECEPEVPDSELEPLPAD